MLTVRFWKDERGMWSFPLCLFLLTFSIPFLYFILDVGELRYVRDRVYTATDAASVAGALQYNEVVTATDASGAPSAVEYVVDEPRAEAHAEATLLKNLQNLTAPGTGIDLVSYTISYPNNKEVKVEATIHYSALKVTKAFHLFYHSDKTIGTNITVHTISMVYQPSP